MLQTIDDANLLTPLEVREQALICDLDQTLTKRGTYTASDKVNVGVSGQTFVYPLIIAFYLYEYVTV